MVDLSDVRQAEYTGENRCWPCTVANVVIATVVSVLTSRRSRVLGFLAFVGSAVVIYLRGYLVPGTPTLTKQYFPDELLRRFDKEPERMQVGSSSKAANTGTESDAGEEFSDDGVADDDDADSASIDIEAILTTGGVVTPCRGGADLCLTEEFETLWTERTDLDAADESALREALGIDSDAYSFDHHDNAMSLSHNDKMLGQWVSSAATAVDVAAADILSKQVPQWGQLTPEQRARILTSLRVFVESCPMPDCDGDVIVGEEAIESCCRSFDVVTAACEECDVRLVEMEWNGESLDADSASDSATNTVA